MLEFLTIAYSLSVLTYHLGALIYLVPIPWRGVKRWGPTLIYDGWASAALASSFYLIQQLTYYFYESLGGSWDMFRSWILEQMGKILALTGGVMLVKKFVGGILGSVLGEVTSPIMWALGSTIFALELMMIVGEAIRNLYPQLLAVGILLFSVPFRIARSVGSGLIAFATIFYICLPLLPSFVNVIGSSTSNVTGDLEFEKINSIAFVRGRVLDSEGEPVPNVHLKFSLRGREVASYSTGEGGYFDAGRPSGGLPLEDVIEVEAYYLGVRVEVKPNPINPSTHYIYSPLVAPNAEYYLELKIGNFKILEDGIAVSWSEGVDLSYENFYDGNFTLEALGSGELRVIIPSNLELTYINPKPSSIDEVAFWGRRYSKVITYNVEDELALDISYYKIGILNVDYPVKPMLNDLEHSLGDFIEDVGREVSKIFFTYFLLPMSYLGILSSISTGLARVLGGSPPKIPFRW